MKVGTFCYSHSRGLGHLAKDFYDHGVITDVLVIRHPSIPMQNWYPGAPITELKRPNRNLMKEFVRGKDAMLFFETPFSWEILDYCREIGVRTYLTTMYECSPEAQIRRHPPHKFICPSLLDMEYFPSGVFLPLPTEMPWRLRTEARHFIHNGGYLGLRGREGTTTLIDAMEFVQSPIRLTIRVQENVHPTYVKKCEADSRIEYVAGSIPFEELFSIGDVYVAPQKFNGCSLPLQEACASGLLMMTTDRFPMNTWLPKEPLIPVWGYHLDVKVGGPYFAFKEALVDPKDLAATIDEWYGRPIASYSLAGKRWAEQHSWEVLKPKWLEVLSS